MRLLRRLEKNHDRIRSAATRQHYIQIYQAIKYLSLDIAEFIEQGPHMAEPTGCVKGGTHPKNLDESCFVPYGAGLSPCA